MKLKEMAFAKKTYRRSFERRILAFELPSEAGGPLSKFFEWLDFSFKSEGGVGDARGLDDFPYGTIELQVIDVNPHTEKRDALNFVRTPQNVLYMVDDGIQNTALRIHKSLRSIIIWLRTHNAKPVPPRKPKFPSMYD